MSKLMLWNMLNLSFYGLCPFAKLWCSRGAPGSWGGSCSAGLQDWLVGLGQKLVADLGVGDGAVFLPQMETQLTLVAEVDVALVTLNKRESAGSSELDTEDSWWKVWEGHAELNSTHGVGLLSGVNAHVALQGLQVTETRAAGVAGVRLLSSVDQNVGPQVSNLTQDKTVANEII